MQRKDLRLRLNAHTNKDLKAEHQELPQSGQTIKVWSTNPLKTQVSVSGKKCLLSDWPHLGFQNMREDIQDSLGSKPEKPYLGKAVAMKLKLVWCCKIWQKNFWLM